MPQTPAERWIIVQRDEDGEWYWMGGAWHSDQRRAKRYTEAVARAYAEKINAFPPIDGHIHSKAFVREDKA